jgi:hypothetical protein
MNPFAAALADVTDLSTTLFPPTSRYHGIKLRTHTLAGGKQVAYLARRFVPLQDRFETLEEHAVAQGDRLDNLAARYLGDPEQFWRLADANNESNPFELTARIDRRLRITLPEGVAAMPQIT